MKEVYPDLTSWIFERDRKLGIPIGSTMFKSSRLVEAVRHIVEQGTADQEVVDEVPSRILKSPELGSGIGYISSDSNSTGKRSMDAGYFSSDQIESTRAVSRRNKAKEILQTGNRKKRSLSDTRLRRKSSSLAAASNFRNGPDGGVSKSKLERGNPDELLYDERTARCRTYVDPPLLYTFETSI